MEVNELSVNAKGGTELMLQRLHDSVPKDLLDNFQIICSRSRGLDSTKKRILWLHDLPSDPESYHLGTPSNRADYHQLVFVSNWQMEQYNTHLGVPYSQSIVLNNAIDIFPQDVVQNKPKDKIKIVYTPTPHRGLEILVPVFEYIVKMDKYKDLPIELDVYSSFNLYGWGDRDQQYQQILDRCKNHPKINYHGTQSNEIVREGLEQSHIFAYPSIWSETSCLCLIEAMSAGLICCHPNYGALPETAGGLTWMYQWDEDINAHANKFAMVLMAAIDAVANNWDGVYPSLQTQKVIADIRFNWEQRKLEWMTLLATILQGK